MTRLSRRTFVGLLAFAASPRFMHAAFGSLNGQADQADVISDDLGNWEKHPTLRALADGFRFLQRPDLEKLEAGGYEIHGADMYALVQHNQSRAIESAEFEAHRLYLDIQYLVSGDEYIAVAPQRGLTVSKPYDESKDIEFYQRPAKFEKIAMRPGRFAVFYPRDAHLPNCHPDRPGPLHKVVVKVRLAALKK